MDETPPGDASTVRSDQVVRPETDGPTIRTDRQDGPVANPPSPAEGGPRPREARPSGLAPGRIVAARYRIVRFIARGGMGEVYEAEDLQLQDRIALKTVRADVAEDPDALERFRREIQIARKATHPNVCRIFDLGLEGGPVEEGGLMFLTMELLDGETVSARIKREGAFSVEEARPLLVQIAAGVDALHAAGIVHRDFKPGNVLLVPGSDANAPARAVVTDFGLARPVVSTESLRTISAPGMVMGTPAYMAPEQVRGEKVTTSADIFAFGVVVYEMLTGQLPFTGTTSWTLAAKRLTDPPVPPSVHVEALRGGFESAILRCLSREPGERFANASQFVSALYGGDERPDSVTLSARPRSAEGVAVVSAPATFSMRAFSSSPRLRRVGVPAALVLLVAVGAGLGAWRLGRDDEAKDARPTSSASVPGLRVRRAVAVAPAAGAAGAGTSWGVQSALSSFLEAGHGLRLVSSRAGDRLLGRLASRGAGEAELRTAARRELGADVIVTSTWSPSGGLGRLDVRLLDSKSGAVLGQVAATGSPEDLVGLVGRMATELRGSLGLPPVSAAEEAAIRSGFPATPETRKLYFEGLASLQGEASREAIPLLEKAGTAAPGSRVVCSALSEAYLRAGLRDKAAATARKAVVASEGVDAETRGLLEIQVAEAARDLPTAIELLGRHLVARPDDLDAGIRLVAYQLDAGLYAEARVTLETLRKLPGDLGKDPRLDLSEAYAYKALGDAQKMLASADRAVSSSQEAGRDSVLAAALVARGMAVLSLGDPTKAISSVDEARRIYESLDDAQGVTLCLEQTAEAVMRKGDAAGAERLLREAVARHRESGDLVGQARVLQNTGTALLEQGKGREAGRLYDESLKAFRAAGARQEAALTLNSLGVRLHVEGELTLARRRYQDALALFQELGDEAGAAQSLTNYGETLSLSGDLVEARRTYDEALALHRKNGDRASAGYVTFRIGELLLLQGDLEAARDRLDEGQRELAAVGDKLGAVDARLARTRLLLAQAKAPEAETEARAIEQIARAEGAADRAATALALLGESLLSQGKSREAADAAASAVQRSRAGTSALYRLEAELVRARISVAIGSAEERTAGGRRAAELARTVSGKGLSVLALEARMVAARAAVSGTGAQQGRAELRAVVLEARKKGLGLLARDAERALAGGGSAS